MKHDHAAGWVWVAILWCAIAIGSVLLHGCAELPFPTTIQGAHAWFCENEACPAEAMKAGGNVIEWSYDRKARACTCVVEDSRGLQSVIEVPMHAEHSRVIPLSHGHAGGPLGLD